MALSFLFGKPKAAPTGGSSATPAAAAADPVEAIGRLNAHLTTLEKQQDMWMKRQDAAFAKAKQLHAKGDKKNAMLYMRRKKMAETQVTKTMSMMEATEAQVFAMQSMATNAEHLKQIQSALGTMKVMRDRLNPDVVDDVRADYEEVMQDAKDIEDTVATGFKSAFTEFDEDELAAELDEAGADLVGPATVAAPAPAAAVATAPAPAAPLPAMPAVPTGDIRLPAAARPAAPVAVGAAAAGGGMEADLAALEAML